MDFMDFMAKPPLTIKFVKTDRRKAVILERTTKPPAFMVWGRTRCMHCDHWCHLGGETLKVVESGEASPMCDVCAFGIVKPPEGFIKNVIDE